MIVSLNYLSVQFFCFSSYSLKLKRWIIPFFAPFEARIASIRPQKGIFCLPANNPFSVKGFLIYAFLATFSLSQISQRASIQVLAAVARNKGLASLPTRLHQVENISGRQLDGCLLLLLRILLARINSPWLKGLSLHIPSPFRGTKGSHPLRKVQFFWTLFKRPLTPPPFRLNIMWWIFLKEF